MSINSKMSLPFGTQKIELSESDKTVQYVILTAAVIAGLLSVLMGHQISGPGDGKEIVCTVAFGLGSGYLGYSSIKTLVYFPVNNFYYDWSHGRVFRHIEKKDESGVVNLS